MTFALVWPSGLTDHLSTLDAAQLMQLDSNLSKALDGADGGTYSLASQLRLTSSGYSRGRMVSPATPFKSTNFAPNSQGYQQSSASAATFELSAGVDLALFDGATITGIVLYFRIIGTHGALPTFPTMSCARLDRSGGVGAVSMNSGDSGSGLAISSAGTVVAYENGHAVQSFTYTVDQNGLIDASVHDVLITIVDESGVNFQSGNLYCGFKILYGGSVANVRFA